VALTPLTRRLDPRQQIDETVAADYEDAGVEGQDSGPELIPA
jgi:hypothetical protein